jgi:pantoate--beta-alanine ligase
MGALHEGHGSLARRAKDEHERVVMTSFVNPRQFNDPSDLLKYPRTPERDRELAESWGVDCFVEPTLAEMWPRWPEATATTVSVAGISERLEGAHRPGHFDGVASVVTKLLVAHGAGAAYFGEKDFQQLAVIRQLVADVALPVEIVGCPIVRDDDGLALSSRNVRLSAPARAVALAIPRTLMQVSAATTLAEMRAGLRAGLRDLDIEYAVVADSETLIELADDYVGAGRVLVAALVDGVRLIDNVAVTVKGN